jgi:hypothetical protein
MANFLIKCLTLFEYVGIRIKWDVSYSAKRRLHFGIYCDTNGCTDSTDFTDWCGFFLFFAGNKAFGLKKIRINP